MHTLLKKISNSLLLISIAFIFLSFTNHEENQDIKLLGINNSQKYSELKAGIYLPITIIDTNRKETNSKYYPAEFEGGITELYKFLGENIKYPAAAKKANIEGKVIVTFYVLADGSIGTPYIFKGIGFGCDEEALRLVSSMPKWKPGSFSPMFFSLPIIFKLDPIILKKR